jgi:hypothetical protein
MDREARAIKRSSKRKEHPNEVEQPRNRTRVMVSSKATQTGPSSQLDASHCISVSRSWSINMDLCAQQQHASRGLSRERITIELLFHDTKLPNDKGGGVKTYEVREVDVMAAPQCCSLIQRREYKGTMRSGTIFGRALNRSRRRAAELAGSD